MIAPNTAPAAPPTIAQRKGFINLKLTPKIAGSVIPSDAERDAGTATDFVLIFLALIPTARQAPNCAKFAADAIGIQVFRPESPANIPASMTLYI